MTAMTISSSRPYIFISSSLGLATFCLLLPGLALAQSAGSAPATCMTLLTADELTKAVGAKLEDMGADTRSEGETECPWMLRGGGAFKTVSVQFFDSRHIKASPNESTPDKFFETYVSAAEGVGSGKRELLKGIGQKAAFVPSDPQTLVIVQRADGIARIVANGLTKAQTIAVARAVATP